MDRDKPKAEAKTKYSYPQVEIVDKDGSMIAGFELRNGMRIHISTDVTLTGSMRRENDQCYLDIVV